MLLNLEKRPNDELPPLPEPVLLRPREGDIIVFEIEEVLSEDQIKHYSEQISRVFADHINRGVRWIVLDANTKMKVIRQPDISGLLPVSESEELGS